VQLNILYLATD